MKITITPSELEGHIMAPASKSSMQRACAAALVSGKKIVIHNPGHSNDDKAALGIIQALDATVEVGRDEVIIDSTAYTHNTQAAAIHCGESGLSIRMFTPLAALLGNIITINGEGSLVTRPMIFFDEIFPRLGVSVQSNHGKLPLVIKGPLQPRNISVNGSLSSQFLTGLLLAYAASPIKEDDVTIRVNDLKSKPYIDLTLSVMEQFGLNVPENENYEAFVFRKKITKPTSQTIHYTVEGDWSGGAFLLVAGAIAGNIMVNGLSMNSTQADKKIVEALMLANAGIAVEAKGIRLHRADLKAFEIDATDCPDLFPPLVALAAFCKGTTTLKGVSRLAHKESDRGLTLQEEFGKMGLRIDLDGDLMYVQGGKGLKGVQVHSRHDHRIEMACAVAGLRAEGETIIEEAFAINKSYPDFYEHLKSLGAQVSGGIDLKNL